jgi:hypothetical protein
MASLKLIRYFGGNCKNEREYSSAHIQIVENKNADNVKVPIVVPVETPNNLFKRKILIPTLATRKGRR